MFLIKAFPACDADNNNNFCSYAVSENDEWRLFKPPHPLLGSPTYITIVEF